MGKFQDANPTIPRPTCKNTNRTTAKCRRMCCRRPKETVEDQGHQVNLFGNRFARTKNTGRLVELDDEVRGPSFKHGRY